MRSRRWVVTVSGVVAGLTLLGAGRLSGAAMQDRAGQDEQEDPVRELVSLLNLESYKATITGLAGFGDRRQGTDRNAAAVDWIEAQLQSYGCTNTERVYYEYTRQMLRPPGEARGRKNARINCGQ